jgi:hypothetical protein
MISTPIALFFKAHIRGYTRKDGTAVRPHEDSRQASLFDAPAAPSPSMPALFFSDAKSPASTAYSNLSNNEAKTTAEPEMQTYPITTAAISERQAKDFAADVAQLDASGPIIKSRYAELRGDLSRAYEAAARQEISAPYLALDHAARPEWFVDVYYGGTSMAAMKKCQRICQAHAGDPLADRALAFFAEWAPIVARLDARKADVTTAAAQREEKKTSERKAAELVPPTKLSMLVSSAVDARKPDLVDDYKRYVTDRFASMVRALGEDLAGLGKKENEGWAKFYDNTMRPVMAPGRKVDAGKLQQAAVAYADAVADSMRGKIMDKAGELDAPELQHLTGMNFKLTGTMGGKKVAIEQDTIVNTSPLGTLFNQFPARIYVDGKFTPEAAFKKLQLGR